MCDKSRYHKKGNNWSICAVFMVITSFPENGRFNLKLYISTSICRTFSNNLSLKLLLLAVRNHVSFFLNYSQTSFNCFLKFLTFKVKKTHKNMSTELFFDITDERNKTFKIWDTVLLSLLSSFKTQIFHLVFLADGWIKNRMKFLKFLFGMINNKNTPLFCF